MIARRPLVAGAASTVSAALSIPLAKTTGGDDAELLRLGHEMDRLIAEENAAKPAHNDGDWTAWDAAYERSQVAVRAVTELPARSLEGFRIKARAVAWCYSGDEVDFPDTSSTDMKLVNAIIRDLLGRQIDRIIAYMVAAFATETSVYFEFDGDDSPEAEQRCDEATTKASAAAERLLDLPKAEALSPDYLPALALIRRRWLVMAGEYGDKAKRDECLLVDAALAGHRFDRVPMLWFLPPVGFLHQRPSDAEFQARWA